MLTQDVVRIKSFMKTNKADWYLKMDSKDLLQVMKMNNDLFNIEVECTGPGGVIENKTMLKRATPQEVYDTLKASKRI